MANFLTIEKILYGYYNFVVNGDVANLVKNDRNDLTIVGDICHFKTASGANIIKKQDIPYGNVTLIDGVTTSVPTSSDDLISQLYTLGFFDWINGTGGGGGVDRFDELDDTFAYFGKDGQGLRVNESELKLEPYVLPNTDYLSLFPTPLVAGKILKVNGTADGYEFADIPAGANGYVQAFTYVALDPQEFTLATTASLISVVINGALADPDDWTQSGNLLTILPAYTLIAGDRLIATGVI